MVWCSCQHAQWGFKSVAQRSAWPAEPAQFNLSLRGAVALTHDAVSALLRLPVLSGLDITGCGRISSMDKMRLVRSPGSSRLVG